MTPRWLYFVNLFVCAVCLEHRQSVTLVEWPEKCTFGSLALNDCNWCRCNKQSKYSCSARVCNEVDIFGHFNDAIADINVGMEGKGFWRSTETACEPGVQYRRSDLICVCTEDGTWPNPVCRDVFRVLHLVQVTEERDPNEQKCSPTKLYLIGCNVCLCPSTGRIDPNMCTKKSCTGEDDILEIKQDSNDDDANSEDLAIYAACTTDKKYKLGCKTCICLKNNRLYCDNCTDSQERSKNETSPCKGVEPGEVYTVDCNLCVCDTNGYSYCSVKKCLPKRRIFSRDSAKVRVHLDRMLREDDFSNITDCRPEEFQTEPCPRCTCIMVGGIKYHFCTLENCKALVNLELYPLKRSTSPPPFEHTLRMLRSDCVVDTSYERDCLICICALNKKGQKNEVCETHPDCESKTVRDLDDLHGYCEPLHVYKRGCNICKCLVDGKTVRCTSHECDATQPAQEPVVIDVVPVSQAGDACPGGSSYKIGCNVCFCLTNGNAICTTIDCKESHFTKT